LTGSEGEAMFLMTEEKSSGGWSRAEGFCESWGGYVSLEDFEDGLGSAHSDDTTETLEDFALVATVE